MIKYSNIPNEISTDRISFRRCKLAKGEKASVPLDSEKIVLILLNGKECYLTVDKDLINITEASAFIPDFGRSPYTIHAVDDIEFILCTFEMNEWDKKFFKGWNLHLPYFSLYSDGVRFNRNDRSKELANYSLIQPFQIGHLSLNVATGASGKVFSSRGNSLQNQWFYLADASNVTVTIGKEKPSTKSKGDFFLVPENSSFSIESDSPITLFCLEYFTAEDIQKNYLAQIYNGRMTEVQ